jgi:hypothetical protein
VRCEVCGVTCRYCNEPSLSVATSPSLVTNAVDTSSTSVTVCEEEDSARRSRSRQAPAAPAAAEEEGVRPGITSDEETTVMTASW